MPLAIKRGGGIRVGAKYHTTLAENENGVMVTLYSTVIFTLYKAQRTVILNTGGYSTPTTIRRMNECLAHYGFKERVSTNTFLDSQHHRIDEHPLVSGGFVDIEATESTTCPA